MMQEIIQMMENTYLDLNQHHEPNHRDHAGWMSCFHHSAPKKVSREAREHAEQLYGERFFHFGSLTLLIPRIRHLDSLPKRAVT